MPRSRRRGPSRRERRRERRRRRHQHAAPREMRRELESIPHAQVEATVTAGIAAAARRPVYAIARLARAGELEPLTDDLVRELVEAHGWDRERIEGVVRAAESERLGEPAPISMASLRACRMWTWNHMLPIGFPRHAAAWRRIRPITTSCTSAL